MYSIQSMLFCFYELKMHFLLLNIIQDIAVCNTVSYLLIIWVGTLIITSLRFMHNVYTMECKKWYSPNAQFKGLKKC